MEDISRRGLATGMALLTLALCPAATLLARTPSYLPAGQPVISIYDGTEHP